MNNLKFLLALGALISTLSFATETEAEIVFSREIPSESYLDLHDAPKMCYKGNPLGVAPALQKIMNENDKLSSDSFMIAFRVGRQMTVYDTLSFFETVTEEERETLEESNPDEVKQWREYDTDSKTVLILNNLGPQGDGTELYATSVKPCPPERRQR